jgi:hypothetical protein
MTISNKKINNILEKIIKSEKKREKNISRKSLYINECIICFKSVSFSEYIYLDCKKHFICIDLCYNIWLKIDKDKALKFNCLICSTPFKLFNIIQLRREVQFCKEKLQREQFQKKLKEKELKKEEQYQEKFKEKQNKWKLIIEEEYERRLEKLIYEKKYLSDMCIQTEYTINEINKIKYALQIFSEYKNNIELQPFCIYKEYNITLCYCQSCQNIIIINENN